MKFYTKKKEWTRLSAGNGHNNAQKKLEKMSPFRDFGNQSNLPPIQAKVAIGQSDSIFERQADEVADGFVEHKFLGNQSSQSPFFSAVNSDNNKSGSLIQRRCASCEDEELSLLQRKQSNKSAPVTGNMASEITPAIKGGQRLPKNIRNDFESHFNQNFEKVKIHTGATAEKANQTINARAFTMGNHIVFGRGEYQPNQKSGAHLLAHELTHVVQQSARNVPLIQRQERVSTPPPSLPIRTAPLISPALAGFLGASTVDGFTFGLSSLSQGQQTRLRQYAQTVLGLLRDHPSGFIDLTGHTDAPGEVDDNVALGLARAEAVKSFLVAEGVEANAIITSSEGEGHLRVETTARSPRNRRVEIRFRTSHPFNLGVDLTLRPIPNPSDPNAGIPSPDGPVPPTPRIPLPSEIPPHILLPPAVGPLRPTQRNIFTVPPVTRPVRPAFITELSRWLTGRLGRREIARLAARMAAELGMDEREIREKLDDALVSAGEAGIKKILEQIIHGLAGPPTSRPPNEFGPIPGGDIPGTRIIQLPAIRF